jgi:hypothetical protein
MPHKRTKRSVQATEQHQQYINIQLKRSMATTNDYAVGTIGEELGRVSITAQDDENTKWATCFIQMFTLKKHPGQVVRILTERRVQRT